MSMTESEAKEKLKLEGGLEISGKPKRVAEFFEALSVAETALEEVQQYRVIGTVSEFRELKEKATAKQPRFYAHDYYCIECGNLVGNNEFQWQRFEYCDKCGQKLDWSEGKE